MRSISVDLGVSIEFEAIDVRKRGADPATQGVYCAIGSIRYPERPGDGETGTIIYIKPGLYLDAPADVRAFAAANAKFPHDSTSNQWFTEPQFESYRALGTHVIKTMCGGRAEDEPMALEAFVASAGEYVAAYRQASDGSSKLRLVRRPAVVDRAGRGRGSGPDLAGSETGARSGRMATWIGRTSLDRSRRRWRRASSAPSAGVVAKVAAGALFPDSPEAKGRVTPKAIIERIVARRPAPASS